MPDKLAAVALAAVRASVSLLLLVLILPTAEISPPVNKFPPVTLPVTVKLVNVPTDVMLGCAAVVTVAAVVAKTALEIVPIKLPPVMLPVVLIVFDPNELNRVVTFELL